MLDRNEAQAAQRIQLKVAASTRGVWSKVLVLGRGQQDWLANRLPIRAVAQLYIKHVTRR